MPKKTSKRICRRNDSAQRRRIYCSAKKSGTIYIIAFVIVLIAAGGIFIGKFQMIRPISPPDSRRMLMYRKIQIRLRLW